MQLLTIQDPRDNLDKARKRELVQYAQTHSVVEIDPNMPAILMRRILRNRGLVDITVPVRPLGQLPCARGATGPSTPENTIEVLAEDDLMQQWIRQQALDAATLTVPAVPHVNGPARKDWMSEVELPSGVQDLEVLESKKLPIDSMKMTELRKACKARGIKMKRTDKMVDLRAKLNGENTSECSQ